MRLSSFFLDGVESDAYELPHPPLGLPVVFVVQRAIERAFELLRAKGAAQLAKLQEDKVTIALRAVLENILLESGEVDGFNSEIFTKVDRQHRSANYNGEKLDKEPGMRFCIRDDSRKQILRSEDGLTVECKPVDARHGPGTDYCDRGIQRFVDGDYAWAMQEAIMIGYIRDGRTICGNLLPVMEKESSIRKLKTLSLRFSSHRMIFAMAAPPPWSSSTKALTRESLPGETVRVLPLLLWSIIPGIRRTEVDRS